MRVIRYICIDLGDKRTGIATSDSLTRIVSPGNVLEVPVTADGGKELLAALIAQTREVVGANITDLEFVVGLPLVDEGREGPRAKVVRAYIARFVKAFTESFRTEPVIHFQDETLTSAAADWSMQRSGMTRGEKKQRRDALAAAIILRDFLGEEGGRRQETGDRR